MLSPSSYPTPSDALSQLAAHVASLLGSDVLLRLRQNPNVVLAYADDLPTDDDWLRRALQTVLALDDIQVVGDRLSAFLLDTQRPLLQQIETYRWEQMEQQQALDEVRQQVQLAETGRERAEVDLFRVRKEMATMLPARPVIELLFQQDDARSIRDLLLEAADQPSPDLSAFLIAFVPAWNRLQDVRNSFGPEPTDNLRSLHSALSQLLADLSGHYLPQRRSVLDKVAQWASEPFADFLFVSPEESAQIDPAIHNAHGIGGNNVIEGISFAVLRRQSRTVVLYADVLAR